MYPPNHVVIIEGGGVGGPLPSGFFTCQKIIIVVLNIIAAIIVAIALIISLMGVLFALNVFTFLLFLLLLLVFAYIFCGIYGPLKEDECVFAVHLVVNVLGTLLQTIAAIVLMTLMAGARDDESSSSSSRNRSHLYSWEMRELSPRRYSAESMLPSVVFSIAWTAFLVVFARNLHRWNQQKTASAGWSNGRQITTSQC